jgi:hypothetical protein
MPTPADASPAPTAALVTPVATTADPTARPATSPVPSAAPGGTLLPAPLYVLELGQIARIERDGVTRRVLTDERIAVQGFPPIATFTVSSRGEIAYVVSDAEADRLVLADKLGQSPRTLYEQQGHELSDLRFTPDGAAILLHLLNNREPLDIPAGLYRLPITGGAPELLRADDPVDDPVNPAPELSAYLPLAFSPDGASLLVVVDSLFYEECTVGVMPAAGGEVVRVVFPAEQRHYCGEAAWSADGSALLVVIGSREGSDIGPNLWRADPATGAAEPLLPPATFVRAPFSAPDNAVHFFLATVERDASDTIVAASFAPASLAPGSTTPAPRGDLFPERIERALWAPDGSGAVTELGGETVRSLLRWVPLDGAPLALPSAEDGIFDLAWGVE